MLALWLACAPSDPPQDSAAAPLDRLSPQVPISELWTAQQVEAELERLLERPLPGHDQVVQPYLDQVRSGDDICPAAHDDQFPEGRIPLGGCTTQDGTYYVGLSNYRGELGTWKHFLWGDFRIERPDGTTMEIGGSHGRVGDEVFAQGSFLNEGGGGWLDGGFGATLYLGVESQLWVKGGLAGLSGPETLWFDLALEECATGEIRTRDPDGRWYTLVLDDCACGPVSAGGQDLGRACVDVDELKEQLR